MILFNRYASELNEIQDAVLEVISVCRDEISDLFDSNSANRNLVDRTLRRLFAYQSDRSQTISYLVSSNYVWDAEIVMRSFYESHAKIWLICQTPSHKRQELVEEFWGQYAEMHAHRRAHRAKPGANLFRQNSSPDNAAVYEALANDKLFAFHEGTKKERRTLEQKWSFSEILEQLEQNSENSFPLYGATALKHMYGQQSHLIHADESALDLMLDRQLRPVDDLELLTCSHVCRIFSDQVSLWTFSTSALRHRYELKGEGEGRRWELWKRLQELIKPFSERFAESQREFYERLSRESQID